MRNTLHGLTGSSLPPSTFNLSFPGNTGDVFYPPSGATASNILSTTITSLWSYSCYNTPKDGVNGITVNMQSIDDLSNNSSGVTGATAYYAIRVNTDFNKDYLVYGNVNINCFKLS